MEVSCAFPTALDSPDNIALAEQLGYHRAWLYDTPQQSPDVWMMLALAAQRTERIGLGPGVLVPSLRHPMVNAAATATLCALAPGRVAVAFGTGFTGRRAMGYPAISWAYPHADAASGRACTGPSCRGAGPDRRPGAQGQQGRS
jgi:5,10-methylenetetrahydromethanopterin reductase